ncbi:uncharacterized protein EDB91DRAFT_420889 [Suillus paluster]|uniref:uncharacterized protein n=1 Tax=Suillus paluster TaxID=48578 RepID=UPI001B867042|nr:uncharacterized protein EDB91DRAFT_420889 [Suillus paluster]KAG1753857.1 hypothetical protein EDB91DRAFT_420889 [Suillus paluster]
MAALPSFIELMASLGINNEDADAKPASTPTIVRTRDRSSSCSSCSSLGSSVDGWSPSIRCANLSTTRDIESDRRPGASRLRAVRYSPYISASSTARQSSVVSLTHSQSDQEDSSRSSSPNPPSSPQRTRRPSPLHFSKRERSSITPISSYVRRKTPQNSPTVLTFAQREREYVERPEIITPPSLMPMSLPTIPPVPR